MFTSVWWLLLFVCLFLPCCPYVRYWYTHTNPSWITTSMQQDVDINQLWLPNSYTVNVYWKRHIDRDWKYSGEQKSVSICTLKLSSLQFTVTFRLYNRLVEVVSRDGLDSHLHFTFTFRLYHRAVEVVSRDGLDSHLHFTFTFRLYHRAVGMVSKECLGNQLQFSLTLNLYHGFVEVVCKECLDSRLPCTFTFGVVSKECLGNRLQFTFTFRLYHGILEWWVKNARTVVCSLPLLSGCTMESGLLEWCVRNLWSIVCSLTSVDWGKCSGSPPNGSPVAPSSVWHGTTLPPDTLPPSPTETRRNWSRESCRLVYWLVVCSLRTRVPEMRYCRGRINKSHLCCEQRGK